MAGVAADRITDGRLTRTRRVDRHVREMSSERPILIDDLDLLVLGPTYKHFIKDQVDCLAEQCRSVTVLVRYNRFADISDYIHIDSLRSHRREAIIDRHDQPENVRVVPLPLLYLPIDYHYRRMGGKHYRAATTEIESRGLEFDLIHAHFTWSSGYVARRLGQDHGVPSVLTVHENEDWLHELAENGHEDIYDTWRNVDEIIRVNEKDVPLLSKYNDAVHSIPNGFSRDRFPDYGREEARSELGVSDGTDVVFSLGGLEERKRFHHVVDAVATLEDDFDDLKCVIGGRGPEMRNLRQQVTANDLEDVVSLPGFLSQKEVALWMNAADLFVLPSRSEGNPTVMFEALGCGTPYVGTNVGGVDEIITMEEHGLVYSPEEPGQLPELLARGLTRNWDRDAIKEYGERFTWERIVDRTVDVYPGVVGGQAFCTAEE